MATFSINQVRHLFVANAVKSGKFNLKGALGTIYPQGNPDKTTLFFNGNGAGGPYATDLIDLSRVKYAKATPSESLGIKLRRTEVKLDADINDGLPIINQEYLLRILFRKYIGNGDEDTTLKYGAVHGVKDMTASKFYHTMVMSILRSIARDENHLLNIYLVSEGTEVLADLDTPMADTYTSFILEEVPQEWRLGIIKEEVIPFEVTPTTVTYEGAEYTWGKATDAPVKNVVPNGKYTADLEYFCMGARGDLYRGIGFPNNITTHYLVDPTKVYDYLDIHFYFEDANEGPQKSERTMTIVAPNDGSHTIMDALITEVNKISGLKIKTLG